MISNHADAAGWSTYSTFSSKGQCETAMANIGGDPWKWRCTQNGTRWWLEVCNTCEEPPPECDLPMIWIDNNGDLECNLPSTGQQCNDAGYYAVDFGQVVRCATQCPMGDTPDPGEYCSMQPSDTECQAESEQHQAIGTTSYSSSGCLYECETTIPVYGDPYSNCIPTGSAPPEGESDPNAGDNDGCQVETQWGECLDNPNNEPCGEGESAGTVDGTNVCVPGNDSSSAGEGTPDTADRDGDGTPNGDDPDMDGDGVPNESDPDIDGDGLPNEYDPSPGGPGTTNDADVDGDGIPDAADDDIDGDGKLNWEDDTPYGGPGNGGTDGGNGDGTDGNSSDLTNVENKLDGVNSKLDTANAKLGSIDNKLNVTNSKLGSIDTNLGEIKNELKGDVNKVDKSGTPTLTESAQSLVDGMMASPIGQKLIIPQWVPVGQCPIYTFDLAYLGSHQMSIHCEVFESIKGSIAVIMLVVWTLTGIFIVLRA